MTKIKCNTLTEAMNAQKYKTPKGNEYTFHKGIFTDIKDPEDALFFLNVGKEPLFEADSAVAKIKKMLQAAIKKLKKEKDVEEEAPEETGALEPTPEDLATADGEEIPIEDQDPDEPELAPGETVDDPAVADGEAPVNEDGTEGKNVFTREGLKGLNAKEQTYLIKQAQGPDATIPRYEKQKIELLLKLQDDGADLLEIQKGYQA